MSQDVLLGLDVGTTETKVLVTTADGGEVTAVAAPTRWQVRDGSTTDTDPDVLTADVVVLLRDAVVAAAGIVGPVRVSGIAATGMAEAGVLLDRTEPGGRALHPVIAWFDPRGEDEIRRLPADLLEQFQGTTGLPVSALATIAKLAWMREQGTDLAGCRWLNVPEYLVHRLGGGMATEMSLLARTGLLDQDTEQLWPLALESLGATSDLIPTAVRAGTPFGRAGGPDVPPELRGAALTVAGHDHPVAAVGCGVVGADEVFDSFGTAEALVRTVVVPLDRAARERLARNGINSVHHVLEGRRLLLAGTKAGLIMRRALQLLGVQDAKARERLDEAACARDGEPVLSGIRVTGADNFDGSLRVTVGVDGAGPVDLWLATIAHGIDEAALSLARMEAEVGPAGGATVAGGWARMRSVRRAKERSLPRVRFSDRAQAGAFGAAMFAAYAVETLEGTGSTGPSAGSPMSRIHRDLRTSADPGGQSHPDADGRAADVVGMPGPTQEFAARFTGGAYRAADNPLEEITV